MGTIEQLEEKLHRLYKLPLVTTEKLADTWSNDPKVCVDEKGKKKEENDFTAGEAGSSRRRSQ